MRDAARNHLIIDGLVVSKWNRQLFEDMKRGGLTAANCTCSIWEGLEGSFKNLAEFKILLEENKDIVLQVYSVDDIERAHREGRVGIILGWQNSTGFGEYLPSVRLFHELGIRIVQLTYNTANMAGFGCYESHDGGLTDFGRELVLEMNRTGIVIDLSHVGSNTAKDVIDTAVKPVAYTHCCPSALFAHPRNKSDEQLRYIAEGGGFVGVATVPPFLPKQYDSTVDDYVDAIVHVMNVVGEENVGLATDITQGQGPEFFDWIASDKGYGRFLVDIGGIPILKGFETVADYPNILAAMERKKMAAAQIDRVAGRNWLRFLKEVWC